MSDFDLTKVSFKNLLEEFYERAEDLNRKILELEAEVKEKQEEIDDQRREIKELESNVREIEASNLSFTETSSNAVIRVENIVDEMKLERLMEKWNNFSLEQLEEFLSKY